MSKRQPKSRRTAAPKNQPPGVSLELAVARIQAMLDPKSQVTQNEWLTDKIGNCRQFDVVIRGALGGRPMVGVIECKDHNRRKGPAAIDAFAKKASNVNANLAMIVSRRGFTKQALRLAQHEGIGTLSLLPNDPNDEGPSLGCEWYASAYRWSQISLRVQFAEGESPLPLPEMNRITLHGKPVINCFHREFDLRHGRSMVTGPHVIEIAFKRPQTLELGGETARVSQLTATAVRTVELKKRFVQLSGDGIFDWQSGLVQIPPHGTVKTNGVPTDPNEWESFDGPVPALTAFLQCHLIFHSSKLSGEADIVELGSL